MEAPYHLYEQISMMLALRPWGGSRSGVGGLPFINHHLSLIVSHHTYAGFGHRRWRPVATRLNSGHGADLIFEAQLGTVPSHSVVHTYVRSF